MYAVMTEGQSVGAPDEYAVAIRTKLADAADIVEMYARHDIPSHVRIYTDGDDPTDLDGRPLTVDDPQDADERILAGV